MLNDNSHLICAATRSLEAGYEHCGQFVSFADERLTLLSVDVAAVDSEAEPEVAFVGFFERDLEFRKKLRLRASAACGAVISRHACRASSQLIGNRTGSRTHRHAICDPQAIKREPTSARKQFAHPFCLPATCSQFNGELPRTSQPGSTF
jgi:hypothetical protein